VSRVYRATRRGFFEPGLQRLVARANVLRGNAHGSGAGSIEEALESLFRPSERLAVYGSLAPGRPNHHVIEDVVGSWTQGFVEGELFEIGWGAAIGYPAMRWIPGRGRIAVDVLISERLPGAWARLDAFEGPDYRRVLIPVFGDGGLLAVANIYEARHERRA
jgi:gamma-glutamylcyclotransferase (GGCT)/AIG2-like uncharacterized protein YtfP